ncbi:fumarylacetoacetate hydrolase family protein [Microbacterium sp. zg.Y1090]|uniref:fumarylacetoacetate hydrolase family protein n=1 Tax=Microbacterium TaxID=33882 RepID=UPI00214BF62A|nr:MULTISPECIES: fumarylacetoacetate hydrolase family protein [unclassified Microbacterium]MCR2811579.1 fumarylacetoacetate hydrolase family protein [Microbacterium sp. zg.Y1084]MCR2818999.1 fumarylacetoacetate hydrolase family protein [Microbacterium sp. zg.Y1090]MDL5487649.1 fumarylacetoacetate hydrolase family protein [Microbacterium sp. zg-Y1211]WIM27304.1 fumarylacetoacetate hydrolase family protein [Microbacterium sp. zg-Y1090]
MKFARLGPVGQEIPVVIDGDRHLDLRPITSDVDGAFLADDPVGRTAQAMAAELLPDLGDVSELRVGAPIARPSAVVCIGMNYAAHAAESGSAPPEIPIMFLKTPNTVVGPDDDVQIPRGSTKTDWEVELGVVIGRRASYLDSPAQARAHIAGFVTANDVSERDFQMAVSGGQWSKGKCAPGFNPTGPWLVTPDDVDHTGLRLRSRVNGAPRQDSTTADMIFSVEHIIWHLSQYLALEPGDLVLTGTPEGVALSGRFPYLAPGDVVEVEIEGLGRQRQTFRAWEATR